MRVWKGTVSDSDQEIRRLWSQVLLLEHGRKELPRLFWNEKKGCYEDADGFNYLEEFGSDGC